MDQRRESSHKFGKFSWLMLIAGLALEFLGSARVSFIKDTEVARLGNEAEAARLETAKIMALVAWREIPHAHRERFKTLAETLPKGRVMIESTATNSEAANLGRQISGMLRLSGYDVVENFGAWINAGAPVSGVRILVKNPAIPPPYAVGLQKALGEIGIKANSAPDERAQDIVMIVIGNKP